jgi:hypothetical protein
MCPCDVRRFLLCGHDEVVVSHWCADCNSTSSSGSEEEEQPRPPLVVDEPQYPLRARVTPPQAAKHSRQNRTVIGGKLVTYPPKPFHQSLENIEEASQEPRSERQRFLDNFSQSSRKSKRSRSNKAARKAKKKFKKMKHLLGLGQKNMFSSQQPTTQVSRCGRHHLVDFADIAIHSRVASPCNHSQLIFTTISVASTLRSPWTGVGTVLLTMTARRTGSWWNSCMSPRTDAETACTDSI